MRYSDRVYVRIDRHHIAMFRFLLEGHENLALMTVVDNRVAWLKVVYAPDQKAEVLSFLAGVKEELGLEIRDIPRLKL